MKVGENGIVIFKVYDLDIDAIDKVIFTFSGIEQLEKEYPSDYVDYSDNRFHVGLTQQDTLMLSKNRKINVRAEAQINFKNGAVKKTDILTIPLAETLHTNIVSGNTPSDSVSTFEFHYEDNVLIIGGNPSAVTESKVKQIVEGYNFADTAELSNLVDEYVTTHATELKGADGKSPYELAVENGYEGTEEEWLASLQGKDGKNGTNGTDGKSAYDVAVDDGFQGTEAEWLESLKGNGFENMTKAEMLEILRGGE